MSDPMYSPERDFRPPNKKGKDCECSYCVLEKYGIIDPREDNLKVDNAMLLGHAKVMRAYLLLMADSILQVAASDFCRVQLELRMKGSLLSNLLPPAFEPDLNPVNGLAEGVRLLDARDVLSAAIQSLEEAEDVQGQEEPDATISWLREQFRGEHHG